MATVVNARSAISTFAAFAMGAYVFGRGALVPGIALYLVSMVYILYVVFQIARPAAPDITVVQLLLDGWTTYITITASCILGLVIGERLRVRRQRGQI